jgi:hypothetical protein
MNERIKKLGLEAADWLDDQESVNTAHAMQLYQKKFAELIVRECADLCESFGESGDGYTCSAEILEHFGVKE